jgi:hypothetical protein
MRPEAAAAAEHLEGDVHACDALLWLGDVNYRVALPNEQVRAAVAARRYDELWAHEQLLQVSQSCGAGRADTAVGRRGGALAEGGGLVGRTVLVSQAIASGAAFRGFVDVGPVSFPPTFKFDKGSSAYDTSEKQRVPAWPDRVLKRTCDAESVELVAGAGADDERHPYTAHAGIDYQMSDHRPVSADLEVGVWVADAARQERVLWEVLQQLDARENEEAPRLSFHLPGVATTYAAASGGLGAPPLSSVRFGGGAPLRYGQARTQVRACVRRHRRLDV